MVIIDYRKWRLCLDGGNAFKSAYLAQNTDRETDAAFLKRFNMTPVPAFAKESIMSIKNALYQRASDITRSGEKTYNQCVQGLSRGVDLEDSTMSAFIGNEVVLDLLAMGVVGVFVDMPRYVGSTIRDESHPYLYPYKAEDIVTYTKKAGNIVKLKLRKRALETINGYPSADAIESEIEYSLVKYKRTRRVKVEEYGQMTFYINIPEIPFVLLKIKYPLMSDVADYQIALLNLESSDVNYIYEANFPFYTQQTDGKYEYNKPTQTNSNDDKKVKTGPRAGVEYPKGTDKPSFIHPSTDPLLASIKKQDKMKEDIRRLVNLSVINNSNTQSSADSQDRMNEGLGAGLASIAQVLEGGERMIARLWSYYMGSRSEVTIKYPRSYSLKSEESIIKDANSLIECGESINSVTAHKSIAIISATNLLAHRVSADAMSKISKELESSDQPLLNYDNLIKDVENNIVSHEFASTDIRHYPKGETQKAEVEHASRVKVIAEAQASAQMNKDQAKAEKEQSQNADTRDDGQKATRGEEK